MEKLAVPRLEDLAFLASYQQVLITLSKCPDYFPEQQKRAKVSTSEFNEFLNWQENAVDQARCNLDGYLVGVISDKLRPRYIEEFYKSFRKFEAKEEFRIFCSSESWLERPKIDIWAFLDSILTEDFEELEIDVSLPYQDPDLKIIPTIARATPELKTLKMNLNLMNKKSVPERLDPLILSLNLLENLTSLSLHCLDEPHKPVLKFIGKSCPSLSHLRISKISYLGNEILAIILGENFSLLFPESPKQFWREDVVLKRMTIPTEYLTPMSSSLKQLQLHYNATEVHQNYSFYYLTIAFALRHLPNLEKMDVLTTEFYSMSNAIKTIQESCSDYSMRESQRDFELACDVAPIRLKANESLVSTLVSSPTFSGQFSITHLDSVSVMEPGLLRFIAKTCPNLKEVGFCGSKSFYHWQVTPEDFESILLEWPKLEKVSLEDVPPKFVKPILKIFGPGLRHLTFWSFAEFNMADLIPCNLLESLRIYGSLSSILDPPSNEVNIILRAHSFLPQLKVLKSDICLGQWLRLLEEKPEMTHIVLNCCHIGTEAGTQVGWTSIPKMWPRLEALRLNQCKGLTMAIVAELLPQMSRLRKISLPEEIRFKEPKGLQSYNIVDICYSRSPSRIKFSFESMNNGVKCPFLFMSPYY